MGAHARARAIPDCGSPRTAAGATVSCLPKALRIFFERSQSTSSSLWALAFYAGLRRGELQGLRWERPVEPDPEAWTTMQPPELAGHDD